MTDLAFELQKALYARLSPAAAPTAVVQHLDDAGAGNFVLLGEDHITEVGGKGARLERHEVTINTVTVGASKQPLRALQEVIRSTLHEQSLPSAAAKFSAPIQASVTDQLLPDGGTIVGTQIFLIFAQEL